MKRKEAIAHLAHHELSSLTAEQRFEQLEIMLRFEAWESHPKWARLPEDVREEFESGEDVFREKTTSDRYDPVLLLWLEDQYRGATNEYLQDKVRSQTSARVEVTGVVEALVACPCCGYQTLGSRGDFEICQVCWWEDDGQDNGQADVVMGGPNYGTSLTQGRINFLAHGIYDPPREDLRKLQQPRQKYRRGRVFVLTNGGVSEPAEDWRSSVDTER